KTGAPALRPSTPRAKAEPGSRLSLLQGSPSGDMRPRSSSTMRLLPLPGLALRVPICVGAVLEDDGNRVQTAEIRGVAVVVRSTAIADRSSLEELPRFLRDLF